MTLFESIILGTVQGLTEFLPVSSSAHLVLLSEFLGEEDQGIIFDVGVHFGTLMAALVYFRSDLKKMIINLGSHKFLSKENNLTNIENQKQAYKTIYFSNNIKDKNIVHSNAEQSI
jgi:undecaprenyl pyrophosphate phosphatase UppP